MFYGVRRCSRKLYSPLRLVVIGDFNRNGGSLVQSQNKASNMTANAALLVRSVRCSRLRCRAPGSLPVQQHAFLDHRSRAVTTAATPAAEVARAAAAPVDNVHSDGAREISREAVASSVHAFPQFARDGCRRGVPMGRQQLVHAVGEEQQKHHTELSASSSDSNSKGRVRLQSSSTDGSSIGNDSTNSHNTSNESCSSPSHPHATIQVLHHLQLRQQMQAETIPFRVHRTGRHLFSALCFFL